MKNETTKPPIIAVINPMIGGKSEAFAIPKLKGKANKNTIKPEIASDLKFSFKPANPSAGIYFLIFEVISTNFMMICKATHGKFLHEDQEINVHKFGFQQYLKPQNLMLQKRQV